MNHPQHAPELGGGRPLGHRLVREEGSLQAMSILSSLPVWSACIDATSPQQMLRQTRLVAVTARLHIPVCTALTIIAVCLFVCLRLGSLVITHQMINRIYNVPMFS